MRYVALGLCVYDEGLNEVYSYRFRRESYRFRGETGMDDGVNRRNQTRTQNLALTLPRGLSQGLRVSSLWCEMLISQRNIGQ